MKKILSITIAMLICLTGIPAVFAEPAALRAVRPVRNFD